jgi:hypothetical protein
MTYRSRLDQIERAEQAHDPERCDCTHYEVEYPDTGTANPAPATCPHGRPWSHVGTISVIYDQHERRQG